MHRHQTRLPQKLSLELYLRQRAVISSHVEHNRNKNTKKIHVRRLVSVERLTIVFFRLI